MRDLQTGDCEVIAVFGPTGVGKTAVAVALAELLRQGGEDPVAVSADALQVYSGLEILTGVASPAERSQLEHRLISFLPLDASFSVGQYAELAHAEIDDLLSCGRRPIVVGGTGLYLRAALAELNLRPPPPEGTRALLIAAAPAAAERIIGRSTKNRIRIATRPRMPSSTMRKHVRTISARKTASETPDSANASVDMRARFAHPLEAASSGIAVRQARECGRHAHLDAAFTQPTQHAGIGLVIRHHHVQGRHRAKKTQRGPLEFR